MSDKYKKLKELIAVWIDREKEHYEAIHDKNSSLAEFCLVAIEAYQQVLRNIKELEKPPIEEAAQKILDDDYSRNYPSKDAL